MANSFFKNGDKAYSENLNDSVLVGNAFDWTVTVSLPDDTGEVFPNSSTVVKGKVADLSITPNSNLSIGSTISNSSGSSQVYRLTVYPDFNRFGGFKSISLTADSGVTFYIANKGGTSPIASNLDYDDLDNVPELKVLKEYDIVLTIPNGKSVSGLEFVFQSSSANVSGSITQANVSGLNDRLNGIENEIDSVCNLSMSASVYTAKENTTITIYCYAKDIGGNPIQGKELTPYVASVPSPIPLTTKTTDNNGMASWSVTVGYGLNTYYVEDATLQIYGYGYAILWQNSQTNPTAILYRNNDKAILVLNGLVTTVPTSWAEYGSNIASTVPPKGTITSVSADHQIIYRINWQGKLEFKSLTGSALSNKEHYIQIEWSII